MRVVSLGSSSSGNALLIEAGPQGRTRLLLDAGLPFRTLIMRLQQVGVSPEALRAILLTHEHSDHVLALPLLLKRYALPVVADPRTLAALEGSLATQSSQLGEESRPAEALSPQEWPPTPLVLRETLPLPVGCSCLLGDIEVTSFAVPHDAVAPCGYLLAAGGCRVCVVTDSGAITPLMLKAMCQADLLILEANHDRERLLRGPYAYPLKMRILSPTGHLSNDQAAAAILHTWRADSVRWLWLSHLSRTNNTPSLALNSVRQQISAAGAPLARVHLSVLPPAMGPEWDSTRLWHDRDLWRL
jgi:phosphoribosyl 1,2-cyclic phosphodiesterase